MFHGSCVCVVLTGLVVAAGTSHAVKAQTITDGTATFQMLTPAFATTLGDATLRNEGVASPDILYKYCWYYRTEVSGSNTVMSKWDTPTAYTQGNQTRLHLDRDQHGHRSGARHARDARSGRFGGGSPPSVSPLLTRPEEKVVFLGR